MNESSHQDSLAQANALLAVEAEAFLRANGVEGITITGSGEDWCVSVGFAPHERFVAAYSQRNPNTPNDPLYLAGQALATLIRNERPKTLADQSEERITTDDARSTPENVAEPEDVFSERPNDGSVDASGDDAELSLRYVDDDAGADEQIDADFTEGEDLGSELLDVDSEHLAPGELPAPPIEDFAPDEFAAEEEPGVGAFIFGDNLHQLRTAAIGLVVQAALTRLPEPTDYAKLSELRNFAMGVVEDRWPDDPGKRDELDAMEAIERRRHAIEDAQKTKVAFLVEASREDIKDFDPDACWPD